MWNLSHFTYNKRGYSGNRRRNTKPDCMAIRRRSSRTTWGGKHTRYQEEKNMYYWSRELVVSWESVCIYAALEKWEKLKILTHRALSPPPLRAFVNIRCEVSSSSALYLQWSHAASTAVATRYFRTLKAQLDAINMYVFSSLLNSDII